MERGDAAGEIADAHLLEAGILHHASQLALRREAADALGKILIGVTISGHHRSESGQHGEGIEVIERAQQSGLDPAELEAEEPAARLQNAPRLGERRLDMRHIAQPEGDGVGVDAGVADGQALGITAYPFDAGEVTAIDGAVAAAAQHALGEIAHDGARAAAGTIEEALRDVAGPAGDVEQKLPGTRAEPVDELRLPQAMDAAAHEIVHEVVAVGDAVEDLPHQMRLLLGVDPAIAEIRLAACLAARHVLQHSAAHPWSATRPMPELPEVETVKRGLETRM